jgi:hypothetical protein
MKLFRFFGVVSAALAQSDDQISSDEKLTDLATEFEGFKFMIDDILRSREEESKHLTVRQKVKIFLNCFRRESSSWKTN